MIDSYSFGTITIDGNKFTKDLIIYHDHITLNWRRKTSHLLTENDIAEILDYKPEILIIGTGSRGLMKVDDKLKEKLKALGIEFVIKKTAEAVKEYNEIFKDKKVVCALHLTC